MVVNNMKLIEFIYHLAHKSISIMLYVYNKNSNTYSNIYDGSVGQLIHWKDFPTYRDYIIENIDCEENLFEVKIYG